MTWYEAVAYCRWLTERLRAAGAMGAEHEIALPSEEQWAKAARGTDRRAYPWGDQADRNRANCEEAGIGATSAVGCFPGGASPYGALDMSGNVWEWTVSQYEHYAGVRVLRGGAYYRGVADCGVAARLRSDENYPRAVYGYRCVSPISSS